MKRTISILLIQLVVVFVGLELAARLYSLVRLHDFFFTNSFFAPPEVTDYAEVNPFLVIQPWTKTPFRSDGYRYRGADIFLPKAKDEIRIFFLGGSTTANLGLQKSFEELLEEKLQPQFPERRIRCINGAMSAYSSNQDLVRFATEVVTLEPDIVVLMEAINDIHELFFPEVEATRFVRNEKYFNQRYFPFLNNAIRRKKGVIDKIYYNPILNKSRFLNMAFFRLSLSNETPSRNRVVLDETLVKRGLKEYEQNLISMKALAASVQAQMVYVSQPIQLDAFDSGFERFGYSINYPSAAQFKDVLKRYGDAMNVTASDCATCSFIPMADRFEAVGDQPKYFADLSHFREAGAAKFAELALPDLLTVVKRAIH